MNTPFYIAQRIAASGQKSFARLIVTIATAAVALSIAVMLIATSMTRGFKSEITNKMFGFWGHIHITSVQQTTSFEPAPIGATPLFMQALKSVKNVEYTEGGRDKTTKGGVHHIQSYATKAGIIKTKDNFEGIILKGVGSDYNWNFVEKNLVEGRKISNCDTCRDILISKSTADRLNLKTGNKFVVHFVQDNKQEKRLFQICGIYKTGIEEYDKRFALVDIHFVQELLGWSSNQVAGFEVFVDYMQDLKPISNHIYSELITNDLTSQTVREEQPAIFDWLDLQDTNEYVILGLMLLVSIINMVTALLILILERINMVGTLKALGTTNWGVQQIFLYYGIIIIGAGLLIGNAFGLGLAWLEQRFHFIKLPEADYYLSYAPIHFDWSVIAFLNIGTLLITSLFLILPTFLITSISPIKAIRFK